jgi:hypothetical protein
MKLSLKPENAIRLFGFLCASLFCLLIPVAGKSPSVAATVRPVPVQIDFRVLDLSWTQVNQGWALASYSCGVSECEELLNTSDGLRWMLAGDVPAKPTCDLGRPCVSKIRFANSQVGYVFDLDVLMTRDGGRSWKVLEGDTYALETAHGNVVRITGPNERCYPFCPLRIEKAFAASTSWSSSLTALPGWLDFVSMQRNGDRIYAAHIENTASGENYDDPISTSADDGVHWTQIADKCYKSKFVGMSAAPFGYLVVQCYINGGAGHAPASLLVSRDRGRDLDGTLLVERCRRRL